jgi:hypothetical protein
LLLCMVALMVGCGGASRSHIAHAETSAGRLSILGGRLHGDPATGCVWVGKKNGGDEVVWPPGYRIKSKPLQLLHSGRVVARSSDFLRLAGGSDSRYRRSQRCAGFVEIHKFVTDRILRITTHG